jgi:hypothetical protein|tara:strand:+ start:33 stop:224 length:192 start_codon:yes stop_codon:yes gene_type:complete
MVRKVSKKKLIDILKGSNKDAVVEEYQNIADCIRSDQVPASDVAKFFANKDFYKWYKTKYLTY